jgi:hypothetical protein
MLVQLIEGFVILAAFLILLEWLHNVTTYDPLMGILPRTLNSFMAHDAKFIDGFANYVVFMMSLLVGFFWMLEMVSKNSGRKLLKNIFLMPVLIPAWVTGTLIFIALLNFIWTYVQVMVINAGIGMIALGTLLLAVMIVLSVARLCSHHAFVAMTIGVALGGLSGLATAGWTGADFNALILELVVGGAVGGGLTYALGRLGETEFVSTRGFFLQHRES